MLHWFLDRELLVFVADRNRGETSNIRFKQQHAFLVLNKIFGLFFKTLVIIVKRLLIIVGLYVEFLGLDRCVRLFFRSI